MSTPQTSFISPLIVRKDHQIPRQETRIPKPKREAKPQVLKSSEKEENHGLNQRSPKDGENASTKAAPA